MEVPDGGPAIPPAAGTVALALRPDLREALLRVPAAAAAGGPCPLVVLLHGAGGTARRAIGMLGAAGEEAPLLLLAIDAHDATWDVVRGGFGPDVAFLGAALSEVFATCPVDRERVVLGGFSDGASYALSLGLANGDLLTHLLAFSPGFAVPPATVGRPRVFVSHGTGDAVLPIDRCSRRIVPQLRAAGHDVAFHEFAGGHEVPQDVVGAALDWVRT